MMVTFQLASPIIPSPGKGSTHSRGRSTSAPELSVALAPPSKGIGTSEELIEHIRRKCRLSTLCSGGACKPNQSKIQWSGYWVKHTRPIHQINVGERQRQLDRAAYHKPLYQGNPMLSHLGSKLKRPPPGGGFRQIPTVSDRFRPLPHPIPTNFVENSDHFRPIPKTMTDQYWQTEAF